MPYIEMSSLDIHVMSRARSLPPHDSKLKTGRPGEFTMFVREDTPADATVNNSLRILRAPTKGTQSYLITSREIVGTRNHFYGGKTSPCLLGDCEPCRQGMPWRWAGYFGIWCPPTNEHAVCEVPAAAGKKIGEYLREHGYLRGVKISLFRAGNRPNGRVLANLSAEDKDKHNMPKALDIETFLCHLWNIPLSRTGSVPERGGAQHLAPTNFDGKLEQARADAQSPKEYAEARLAHLIDEQRKELELHAHGNGNPPAG